MASCRWWVIFRDRVFPQVGFDSPVRSGIIERIMAKSKPAQPGPPINVLVVDRRPSHAEAVADSLQSQGYACTIATSGQEGVELIERATYEIIVSDLKIAPHRWPGTAGQGEGSVARRGGDFGDGSWHHRVGRGSDAARSFALFA